MYNTDKDKELYSSKILEWMLNNLTSFGGSIGGEGPTIQYTGYTSSPSSTQYTADYGPGLGDVIEFFWNVLMLGVIIIVGMLLISLEFILIGLKVLIKENVSKLIKWIT